MKYYIEFPISFNCNLQCYYCFHQEYFEWLRNNKITKRKWHDARAFTLEQYHKWFNKFIPDATEVIMHLHGGEPFCDKNVQDVYNVIDFMKKERIDILTNGTNKTENYEKLQQYKSKIRRIGFTFHRTIIGDNEKLVKQFEKNVLFVKSFGIPIYVKELLIPSQKHYIIDNKRKWKELGIDFKIQDFKGVDRGWSHEEYVNYTPIDHLLVDNEYKHPLQTCSCQKGYKNILIRGFDEYDDFPTGGDIVACWHDPTVVGNINEMWYNPNYKITKHDGIYDIKGVDKLYRGKLYDRDLYVPEQK